MEDPEQLATVRRAAEATLEGVEGLDRRVLVYASALGHGIDFPLLVAAMEVDEEALAEAFERLVALGIFRERPGGDRFYFQDEAQRSQLYRGLTQSRLRVVHRKIGEAMERRYPNPSPEVIAELGRHFFLGRIPDKSYAYNLEAADHAEASGATQVAALHLERVRIDRANVGGLGPEVDSRLAERLGHLYYALGDLRAAARLFAEGLDSSDPANPRRQADLWIARATVARDLKETDAAMAGTRRAKELYEIVDDVPGRARVHRTLVGLALDRGRDREAIEEGMTALDLLKASKDPATLGALAIDIGNAFRRLDPDLLGEAIEWYDRAIRQLAEAGNDTMLASAYLARGRALRETRPAEALEDLASARAAAERAHDPVAEAEALLDAVPARLKLGQVDEADRDNQLAGRLVEVRDAPALLGRARLNDGLLKERRGQWEEAEAAYRRALEQAFGAQDEGSLAEGNFCLARLHYKTREIDRARAAFLEAARRKLGERRPELADAFLELGRQLEQEAADDAAPAGSPDGRSSL
jgi:tetratricopeptide (TPR) repeat protein